MSQVTGTSYILTFFLDLKNLGDFVSAYSNALLKLEQIKKRIGVANWTPEIAHDAIQKKIVKEEEINSIEILASNVRYWTVQLYLKISGLEEKIIEVKKNKKELEELCRKIQKSNIPNYLDAEKFCIITNKIFTNSVLQEIIIKNKDFYEKVSGMNQTTEEEFNE